ncbi:MAG TPA: hypothetical protein P5526_07705 [Anaerolineae bacterium]|nr:hypothetical protein [Anaerolineae bacterium]
MIRRKTLNPNERLLIESPVNRYRIVGPGRVYLTVRQRVLAKLYVGPQARSLQFEEVRTAEDVPLKITLKVIYRANPELFTCDLLPKIPGLNDKGWASSVEWHAEYVLRQLVAHRSWQEIGRDEVQKRLERQFTQTLEDRLKMLGLQVLAGCVIKTALPASLQQTLIQAERDRIEAVSRANILKSYLEVFGQNLPQAMPYIVQWEMMNTIHKNNPHILLTPNGSLGNPPLPGNGSLGNIFQLQLPIWDRNRAN